MNLLNLIEDQNTGYQNLRALMQAVLANSEAQLDLDGELVTLTYPEARFILGKYKAYNKAGRQAEFIRDLGNSRQFDLHMKQLRDLIQKQKDFRGSGPSVAETKKKTSSGPVDISSNARAERMLTQLRFKNPQAENDLEALIFDLDKQRRRQDRDEVEIARLDIENDREAADIDRIERDLQKLRQQRGLTEKITIVSGEFQGRGATMIESHKDFVTVDIEGFGRHLLHQSRVAEMQTDINRFNIDRAMLPSGQAKVKYAQDNNIYDDARVQEGLRLGEYHTATVTLDDGTKHRVRLPQDEGFREIITRHFARQGRAVTDIDVDYSVRSDVNEKKDACYNKVKSRYKIWPSAYASGALVQCRKKGAANWGTGSGKK